MDLDFDFGDPLLEYFHMRPVGSGIKYLISRYLVDALQRQIFKPSGAVCEWNPQYFAPCICVDTLLGFIIENPISSHPSHFPGYVITGQMQDAVLSYHFSDARPSTQFKTLTLHMTYKFNEIHKISTSFGLCVERPDDLLWEEIGWVEEQKYCKDPSVDAGYI